MLYIPIGMRRYKYMYMFKLSLPLHVFAQFFFLLVINMLYFCVCNPKKCVTVVIA